MGAVPEARKRPRWNPPSSALTRRQRPRRSEEHTSELQSQSNLVCRLLLEKKKKTRAFPAGHPETPSAYKSVGQPVLIPGDMATSSFVIVVLPTARKRSFRS